MRSFTLCALAVVLVACRKSTPPAPAILETSAPPPPVATIAPVASATVTAIADAAADVEEDAGDDADAEDDAGQAAWVTAQSTGCLGWNPSTRHAVCIIGASGAGRTPMVRAKDMFDDDTPRVNWLATDKESDFEGDDPPPAANVAKVAKFVARLHLTPIDPKTARKIGPGEELALTAPKPITLRFKRVVRGDRTEDTLESVCNGTTQKLQEAGGKTKRMPVADAIELYVDPTSTMGLIVWPIYRNEGVSASVYHNAFFAQGIDFTAKDYCPQPTLLL